MPAPAAIRLVRLVRQEVFPQRALPPAQLARREHIPSARGTRHAQLAPAENTTPARETHPARHVQILSARTLRVSAVHPRERFALSPAPTAIVNRAIPASACARA